MYTIIFLKKLWNETKVWTHEEELLFFKQENNDNFLEHFGDKIVWVKFSLGPLEKG
jgi:hypothetical protein